MAGSAPKIMAAAPATASVRAGVAAAVTVCLVTLSIATFELSMADWPSGFVLMVILPLASLLFFACGLWSATLLLRIRKDGVRFAVPFLICALTLLALVYAPLQPIYLQHDFRARRADRERIVARVENGELIPNVVDNKNLSASPMCRPAATTSSSTITMRRLRAVFDLARPKTLFQRFSARAVRRRSQKVFRVRRQAAEAARAV
jgi:hypothetical protein